MTVAGYVHDVGPNVTRFKKGDRVLSTSAMVLYNDPRYGAFQKYTLTSEDMTSHVYDQISFPRIPRHLNLQRLI